MIKFFLTTFILFLFTGCSSSDNVREASCNDKKPTRNEKDNVITQSFPCKGTKGEELSCKINSEDLDFLEDKITEDILKISNMDGSIDAKVKKLNDLYPRKEYLNAAKYRNCVLHGRSVIEQKKFSTTNDTIDRAIDKLYGSSVKLTEKKNLPKDTP